MRPPKLPLAVLAASLTLLAGCGDDDQATTTSTTIAQASTTATPTTSEDANAELCQGWVDWIGAQDGAQLNTAMGAIRAALPDDAPAEVTDAFDTLEGGDGEFEELSAARVTVGEWIQGPCGVYFAAEVVGGDDVTVSQDFFDAVVAGDKQAAAVIAPADVLAEFEPWEPIPRNAEVNSPSMQDNGDGTFSMLTGPTLTWFCTVEDGVVVTCGAGE